MNTPTPAEIMNLRIEVADVLNLWALLYEDEHGHLTGYLSDVPGDVGPPVPEYSTSLDAMRSAEMTIPAEKMAAYAQILARNVGVHDAVAVTKYHGYEGYGAPDWDECCIFAMASAYDRALAFVEVMKEGVTGKKMTDILKHL